MTPETTSANKNKKPLKIFHQNTSRQLNLNHIFPWIPHPEADYTGCIRKFQFS
jgi:hypothetical protein